MRRRPRRIWHRGRGRRRIGWFDRLRIIAAIAALLGIAGYAVWLFTRSDAAAAVHSIWLPLIIIN